MTAKRKILYLIISELEKELTALNQSAQSAHEAATHAESKAEDQHDTRGLEASYLAGAQSARVEQLKSVIDVLQRLELPEFKPNDPVRVGALVELRYQSQKSYFLILNFAGGKNILCEGMKIQLITPHSPMGEAILDRKAGDLIEVEGRNQTREYEIVSVK